MQREKGDRRRERERERERKRERVQWEANIADELREGEGREKWIE